MVGGNRREPYCCVYMDEQHSAGRLSQNKKMLWAARRKRDIFYNLDWKVDVGEDPAVTRYHRILLSLLCHFIIFARHKKERNKVQQPCNIFRFLIYTACDLILLVVICYREKLNSFLDIKHGTEVITILRKKCAKVDAISWILIFSYFDFTSICIITVGLDHIF